MYSDDIRDIVGTSNFPPNAMLEIVGPSGIVPFAILPASVHNE